MPIPARILRSHADDLPNARPKWSPREQDREDRILATATSLMARFGRANVTFATLAFALRRAPATIRRHFADLDTILAELLRRHMMDISRALGQIPFEHRNRQAAQRAAYLEHTRNGFSAPTPTHTLLIRDRHTLPPDLIDHIEGLRTLLGQNLGHEHGETILALLDNPFIQIDQIETMFAALIKPKAHAKIRVMKYRTLTRSVTANTPAAFVPSSAFPPPQHARAGPAAAA